MDWEAGLTCTDRLCVKKHDYFLSTVQWELKVLRRGMVPVSTGNPLASQTGHQPGHSEGFSDEERF